MSRVLSSAHVHTTFCDGRSTAEEMAQAAYELGFVSLGFSSHAPQTFDLKYCVDPAREDEYIAEIRRIQQEYAGRMAVYLGTERDMQSCADPKKYDYFIAAVHYFMKPDGSFCAVDGPAEEMRKYVDEYFGGDGLRMAQHYFSLMRDYVTEAKPQIIGHFDLIKKNNSRLHLYDEDDAAYRAIALEALRAMRETDALLEVNTGGVARGYMDEPYPSSFLLKAWREWGGEVIINSDCHFADKMDAAYDKAEELLLSLGYDHAVRLNQCPERGMWETVSLR
ncbi:MAG: histidinol-phosphatase [Oscillospiraceae bacterium]|nr:histidinol-phosphatase [Oscillospiraceae bacterium]